MFSHLLRTFMFGETEDKNTAGEKEFNQAKAIWNTISQDVMEVVKKTFAGSLEDQDEIKYKKVFPQLKQVISLLDQSAQKEHYEGTRCYAGLQLISMAQRFNFYYKERNPSFLTLQTYLGQNQKVIQNIIQFLNKKKFAKDEFSQASLFFFSVVNASIGNDDSTNLLSKIMTDPFSAAYALIKVRQHNNSLPDLQAALANEKKKPLRELAGIQHFFLLIIPTMKDESVLALTKMYTLGQAIGIVSNEHTSLNQSTLACDFFTLPPPSQHEITTHRKLLLELADIATGIVIRSNTRTIYHQLQQMPHVSSKPKLEEKPKEPPKEKQVTPNSSQPVHPVPAPKPEGTEPVRMVAASPRR